MDWVDSSVPVLRLKPRFRRPDTHMVRVRRLPGIMGDGGEGHRRDRAESISDRPLTLGVQKMCTLARSE